MKNTKTKGKIIISVLLGLIVIMCFLIIVPNGRVKNVEIIPVSSEIYSEKDIKRAVKEIKKSFIKWKDCELLTLEYVGDEQNKSVIYEYLDNQYGVKEHIVFEMTFKVGKRYHPSHKINSIDAIDYCLGRNYGENWRFLTGGHGQDELSWLAQ